MLRVLWVLTRIVFISYLVLCIFLFPVFVWMVFVFYNADIIPVSEFLYFFVFLDRATNATVIHLSANTTG